MASVFKTIGWEDDHFPEAEIYVDIIGIHYENVGTQEEPLFKRQDGYLVNLRVMDETDVSLLEPYFIEVKTPIRVWA